MCLSAEILPSRLAVKMDINWLFFSIHLLDYCFFIKHEQTANIIIKRQFSQSLDFP